MWVSGLKLSYSILGIIGNPYFYKVAGAAFAADEVDHRFSPLRFVGAVRPPNTAQNVETHLRRVHAPCDAPFRLRVRIDLCTIFGRHCRHGAPGPREARLGDHSL